MRCLHCVISETLAIEARASGKPLACQRATLGALAAVIADALAGDAPLRRAELLGDFIDDVIGRLRHFDGVSDLAEGVRQ